MNLDAEQVVDVSHLQHFDRNWDGRDPKEGEKAPAAYRYIILVWGSGVYGLGGATRASFIKDKSCTETTFNALLTCY